MRTQQAIIRLEIATARLVGLGSTSSWLDVFLWLKQSNSLSEDSDVVCVHMSVSRANELLPTTICRNPKL